MVVKVKIEKVRVRNFRSFKDSREVKIDERITTMIGKNESGKTNFLKALESINRNHEYVEDDLCYYSEAVAREAEDIEMVTIWFKTDNEDKDRLKKLHAELAKVEKIKITKYYDDHYTFKITEPRLNIGNLVAKDAKQKIKVWIEALSKKMELHMKRLQPFAAQKPTYEAIMKNFCQQISLTHLSWMKPSNCCMRT